MKRVLKTIFIAFFLTLFSFVGSVWAGGGDEDLPLDVSNSDITNYGMNYESNAEYVENLSADDFSSDSNPSSNSTTAPQGRSTPTGLASPSYMLDPSMFSPSTKRYTGWTIANTRELLATLSKYLLITITTLATILIIVGGIFMATSAGDHEKASRGKAIVSFNVTAIVIALFSYSIIQLVRWIML